MKTSSLKEKYGYMFADLAKFGKAASVIDETNVYQEANEFTRPLLNKMLEENLLPGSQIKGLENFKDFLAQIKSGKRGLILMEHYSNMDLPAIIYLLDRDGGEEGKELSKKIVAIAGMKLNEENPMVRSWAEAFTRVVIYPSRSLASLSEEEREAEEAKSRKINMASMRAMDKCKREGKPILVFPAGTRYRPGNPETKKGVREIDSYLRMFDIMVFVSVNGNCLRISADNPSDMLADQVHPDTVILSASPVMECKKFRNDILATLEDYEGDKKLVVVDKVMEELNKLHEQYRPEYERVYKETTGEEVDIDQG
jgi:glycerol-3-phosphate O-acyltransferase